MNGSGSARTLSRLWLLAITLAVIALLYLAKIVFLPLAFAILFAFLLAPLVDRLERIRLPRTVAAVAVIVTFAALLGATAWGFFTQFVAVANDLPTYRENIEQKLAAIHQPNNSAYASAEREIEHLGDELDLTVSTAPVLRPDSNAARKPIGTTPERPVQVKEVAHQTGRIDELSGFLGALTTALLSVVFTFFVLLEREDLRNRLIRLSGGRNLSVLTQAMDDASRRISRFFLLQLLLNAMYGSIVLAVLWAVGLPHPLLFGALAAMLRFVPYIGLPVAALLSTGLSLAVFHGWQQSLIIAGAFLCLEIVTANYLEPRVYGRHTGLSPLAIVVAAAFWTLLWGPVGLVLSVPLTVCLIVMGRHVPGLEYLTVMLGDKPAIDPWMSFYQRLLARDEREASAVLETALRTRPLEELYDSVLIPALAMSEEDRQHNDLDESTVRYIRSTVRESIDELGFREDRDWDPKGFESVTPEQPAHAPGMNVMCVPVRDETDELTALMLAQVLDNGHAHAFAVPAQRIDDILGAASSRNPDVVFLSALPPVGFARCHRIYRTLRARIPRLRVMIGIWSYAEDPADAAKQISGGEETQVWTRMADAVVEVRSMARGDSAASAPSEAMPGETAA